MLLLHAAVRKRAPAWKVVARGVADKCSSFLQDYCSVTANKSDWQNDENRGNCMAQGGASCGSYTSFD